MSVNEYLTASEPAVDLDSETPLRIDCYVRSTAPPTITEAITDTVERLQRLSSTERIDTYRTTHWPPECHTVDPTDDDRPTTRDELVGEFERWAAHHGHSLEPAFRRREIRQSLLEPDCDDARERLRVPFISLAIYEADDETGEETLRGVVPYTEHPQTDDERTYTVDEWLSAVDPSDSEPLTEHATPEQSTRLGGHQ
ncbi:HTH domain-containing protein [Natronorubrum thiooxidans]|uniref:Uncharacterized protein n=1 Tax=Natronorubrum thiooxidans TaxID=308853 RepID=A0A1N7H163_9EURY|nr:HTH domain-containing protein [Natronorubrum thiooxidans]SIS18418.1 hypothetical protein SAMN05421752_12015 [Natronorubrum thiooxidans]